MHCADEWQRQIVGGGPPMYLGRGDRTLEPCAHFFLGLLEGDSARELAPEDAVPVRRRYAARNEITHPRQTGEGLGFGAQAKAQVLGLREPVHQE